jgi:hypothetical protein
MASIFHGRARIYYFYRKSLLFDGQPLHPRSSPPKGTKQQKKRNKNQTEETNMKTRFSNIAFISAITALGGLATTVRADSPHFVKGPTAALTNTGDYCVSFKEAGLGSTPITYTITAQTATFTFQCFTKSGNQPSGEPNSKSFSNESNTTTLTPHNGQITASLCLVPEQDGAHCQGGGLVLKVIHVDYQGVTFCDTGTNGCVNTGDMAADVTPPARL